MTKDDEDFMKDKKALIRPIMGNCWWTTHAHPVTKTIVSRLSQLTNSFNRNSWKALMWLCGYYLAKADEPVFFYRKQWDLLVCAFSDSGWKSNPVNMRSRDGFVTLLMENPVHEETHEQPLVALSTSEAECYGMGRAAKFSEWLMLLLNEIGIYLRHTRMFTDCASARLMILNPVQHVATRHFRTYVHRMHEWVTQEEKINFDFCPATLNLADGYTKVSLSPLQQKDFCRLLYKIGPKIQKYMRLETYHKSEYLP
jgi:hypothetical protein